jgi:hypothetical protein
MVEALVEWAEFIHEHGVDAAIARVDTAKAEREAAKDRSALLDAQGADANHAAEKIVEIRVVSAFGYFSPALVANVWNSGREVMAPREVAREYLACNAALGRAKLADVAGLEAYCEAAAAVVAAVDVAGLPLFAGVRAEPVPSDPAGAAIHHGVLLRELRGSVHLVAVVASGLVSQQAHAIKRPGEVEMFGWREPIEVDETHRAALARAEELTNELLVPAFSVLDDAGAAALVAGTDAIHAALTA